MADGSRQGGDDKASPADPREAPIVHEDLPDILEIFGSDPLVKGSTRPARDDDDVSMRGAVNGRLATEEESMWDPMASPVDEADDEESYEDPRSDARETRAAVADDDTGTGLRQMHDLLQLNEDRLGRLETTLESLSKQTNFLPPKLRGLGKKVDELSTTLGDARIRSLLSDVVGLADLAEGALRAFDDEEASVSAAEVRRYFKAMATRVGQILESNDLQEIPTDTEFDPTIHNAIDVTPVADESLDGRILDVVRRGYRSEHSVLRYAEVTVGRLDATTQDGTGPVAEGPIDGDPLDGVPDEQEPVDGIAADFAPFLGPSGTVEDSKNLTMRGTRRSSEKNTDDQQDPADRPAPDTREHL